MNRIIGLMAICLLIGSQAFAAPVLSASDVRSATDDAVEILTGAKTTIYTKAIKANIEDVTDKIGVIYKSTCQTGNAVNTNIEMQQSFRTPVTEGANDDNYVIADIVDATVTDSNKWALATIDTVAMPWIRFKITGQGSNEAGTVTQIKIVK